MTLSVGSLFAGVGGFDLGLDAAGFDVRWQVEWDRDCRAVLARHWPAAARYGDVRDVNGAELEPVDVVTFGFPCQDLSVAGRRAGLDGERSGLFFEALRIIREMREATGGACPTWAVAENVVGLLSADDGHAMGRVVDELADAGAVVVEWAVVDARWFGVPQRRRRVFVVAGFDPRADGVDPLLPVAASVPRDLATRREAGAGVAALTANGVGTCGADDNQAQAGHLVPFHLTQDPISGTDGSPPTLSAGNRQGCATIGVAYALAMRGRSDGAELEMGEPDVYNALRAGDGGASRANTVLTPGLAVRRLTPRECERLMGWPDDHTRWRADGTEVSDSVRYRMCGNGVAAPVAAWIGRALLDATATMRQEGAA